MALSATQFVHLPVTSWRASFEQGKKLPTPYPQTIEEMIAHGFTDQSTIDYYRSFAEIEYFPPTDPEDHNFVLVKATTPRGSWVCTLGFDRQWIPNNTKKSEQ